MKWSLFFTIIFEMVFCGCTRLSFGTTDDPAAIRINRFDTALYAWIESDDSTNLSELRNAYPEMMEVFGKALFQHTNTDSQEYDERTINYFSEPTLKTLYADATAYYSPDSTRTIQIAKELGIRFTGLKTLLPQIKIPAIYFHVSGWQQNFIVADSLISCSIDKYLGSDYYLYRDYFYEYQLRNMTDGRIVNDFLTVWLKSEYPFQGRNSILLDRMIYEGKIAYILYTMYKHPTYGKMMNMTDDESTWLNRNERAIWTAMIERKHLYTSDIVTTDKYFLPAPATFLSDEAPGSIGTFIGFKIITSYMKHTKSSCEQLMQNNDSQDILKAARYKP